MKLQLIAYKFYEEIKQTKYIFKVNHIFRISLFFLHVSALCERHLQWDQKILMKLCLCYVISAELSEGREWIPSVCSQSVGSGYRLCAVSR
jgi:hypothetical protein